MKTDHKRKLFARFLAGVSNSEEEKQLLDTPEIKRMMQEHWDSDDWQNQLAEKPNLQRILTSIYRKIATESNYISNIRSIRRKIYFQLSSAAAILIILITLGFFAQNTSWFGFDKTITVEAQQGVRSEIFLPDGSRVWLNSGGTISYNRNFDGKLRLLELSGEAYFNISTDPNRPFRVITDKAIIEVTGTRFHVVSDPQNDVWETTLMDGAVSINSSDTKIQFETKLTPGQKASWNSATQNFSVNQVDSKDNSLGFKTRMQFDNQPLEVIAEELESTFGVEIKVPQSLKNKYRFTATFTDESIFEIFNLLKISAPIDFTVQGNTVIVTQQAEK